MNLIILNCSWCGGEYSIALSWDENKAHYEIKHYHLGEITIKPCEIDLDTLSKFLNKIDEVDPFCLDREYLPLDGMYLEDGVLFDFLYVRDNYFCTTKWQLGTENEDITIIEDAIAMIDPEFSELFQFIE